MLRARAEGGEQVRFVPELPFSVLVVDETAAIVDVSRHAPDGGGSLLVRQPALVRSLAELVETVWRLGTPAGRARTAGLDQRDTAILTLRALMDQLGAGTRFQAGVQAARRGWL